MDLFKVLFLVLSLIVTFSKTTDAVSCYTCDHVSHPRDCDRVMECQSGEICFVSAYVQSDGHAYYKTGCRAQTTCSAASTVLGRRDLSICNRCCTTNFCNKELCDAPPPTPHGPRCLQCTSVEDPTHCGAVTECKHGEVCFTQEKYVFGERRYQLGCASQGCLPLATYRRLLQARAGGMCLKCCSDENCNRDLCRNTGAPLTQSPVTVVTHTPHRTTGAHHVTVATQSPHHTTAVQNDLGCYYKGHVHHTGDQWEDGCQYTCTCVDGTSGRYQCRDKCPTYTHIPSNCQLETPPGECCAVPKCNNNFTSTTLNDNCFYAGQTYSQGEKWRDGCKYNCECLNAEQGQYRCTSLCYTWNLPSACTLEGPAPGKCCQVPKCPSGFTINYPPGYVEN